MFAAFRMLQTAAAPSWGGGPAMPSGALGVYYVGDYDAAIVAIPNDASALPVSPNMLRWPKRFYDSNNAWSEIDLTGSTVNDSSGNPRARRITSAGTQYARLVTGMVQILQAGATYTLVVKCKSAVVGVSQNVPLGGYFPISTSVQAVGDSWTRLVHTFTNGGGETYIPMGICDMAGGNAFSIDVESIEMFPGASDFGDDGDPGHLYLGRIRHASMATVAAGALTYVVADGFFGSQRGFVTFPGDTQSTDVTYIAVMRRPSSLTGGGKRGGIFESGSDFDVLALFENQGLPAATDSELFQAPGSVEPERGWDYIAMGWQCMAIRITSTTATLFLNGEPVYIKPVALGTLDLNSLMHGSYFGASAGYNHSATAIYDRALTNAEVLTASDIITARSVTDGITMGTEPKLIVMEGDSKVAEDSYNYGWKLEPLLSDLSVVSVYATGGSNLGGVLEVRKSRVTDLYSATRPFVLVVDVGTNDLPGISGATYATSYKSYLDSIIAAVPNIKIVVIPLLSRSTTVGGFTEDTSFTTERNILNADMATWVAGGHCHAVLDLTGKAYFADNACTNAALLEDGWHHSAATSADIAAELAALIDSL